MLSSFRRHTEDLLFEAAPNVHLEHIEEIMLDGGVRSALDSFQFLQSLRNMLDGGKTKRKFKVTWKADGAPAIWSGTDPEDGKFFVATKSLFNKVPKVNKTPEDIRRNHSGGLAEKLLIALKEFSALGIKTIVQGDMMFTKTDLEEKEIDGENFLIFQPNTIVYAVPTDSKLAKEIRRAKIGVVWHTTYSGSTLKNLKASFGADVTGFKKTSRVWFRDAFFEDKSGSATFTESEGKAVDTKLAKLEVEIRRRKVAIDTIAKFPDLVADFKIYNNSKIREGEQFPDAGKHVAGFFKWFSDRHKKQIASAKRENTRAARAKKLLDGLEFMRSSASSLTEVVSVMIQIVAVKNLLLRKLEQVGSFSRLFVRDSSGYRITSPEGFVAINHTGKAVKLVDRLEFSKANFTATKNWVKG